VRKSVLCIALFCAAGSVLSQPNPAPTPSAESVRIMPVEAFSYAAVEMRGTYDQSAAAFQSLYQNAGMQGLPMTSTPFGLYWNSPENTPVDSLRWELGLMVPDSTTAAAPLVLKKYRPTEAAALFFEGVYGSPEQNAAYGVLFGWVSANGYRPAGPMMERYLNMPTQTADGKWTGRVEMVLPVEKTK
jgi:AraC family transcriptional regulator